MFNSQIKFKKKLRMFAELKNEISIKRNLHLYYNEIE